MKTNSKYNAIHHGVILNISEDNLVHILFPQDLDFGLKQAKSIESIILKKIGSEKFTIISDFTDSFGSMTSEAQRFFASEAKSISQIKASAIIVNNLPIRILVKFYLNFFKPNYPTKIFANVALAKEWFMEIENQNVQHASNVG